MVLIEVEHTIGKTTRTGFLQAIDRGRFRVDFDAKSHEIVKDKKFLFKQYTRIHRSKKEKGKEERYTGLMNLQLEMYISRSHFGSSASHASSFRDHETIDTLDPK